MQKINALNYRSRWLKAPDKTRTRLTSDNFYDYYDYVEVVPGEESANNYMNQWTQSSSFFPKVHMPSKPRGNQLPKRRNSLNYKKMKDKRKYRPSAKSQIKEMPSSFSAGSWIQPPHSPDRDSHIPEYEVFNEINNVKYNDNVKYKLPPLSPSRPSKVGSRIILTIHCLTLFAEKTSEMETPSSSPN